MQGENSYWNSNYRIGCCSHIAVSTASVVSNSEFYHLCDKDKVYTNLMRCYDNNLLFTTFYRRVYKISIAGHREPSKTENNFRYQYTKVE